MSGPKTSEYELIGELLAHIEAERERQRRAERHRREQEQKRREAERARLARAQAAADEAERRAARLERLARAAGEPGDLHRPEAPGRHDADALEAYARSLSSAVAHLESTLQHSLSQAAQRMSAATLAGLARSPSAAELLAAFSAQANAVRSATAPDDGPERRRERALKVLGRLASGAANALPASMEALMAQMIEAPNETRAQALELELRLQVQRFNEEEAQRARDVAEAGELLAELPDAAVCDAARQDLELAAAGMAPLTDALRAGVREARAAWEKQQADARREAASRVLAQTLQDLGYAVDGIENTLFVEGGVAHINKAEWGDYYVRLRVDPSEQTVNFNMVREREQGDTTDPQAADLAAETSWCSGLPQLMRTLEARGLPMQLKRQLAAGALPVQRVEPGAIPPALKRAAQERAVPKAQAKPQ